MATDLGTRREWRITPDGKLVGPGGSVLYDVAKRCLNMKKLWADPVIKEKARAPESYAKPERVRGGQPMPRTKAIRRRRLAGRILGKYRFSSNTFDRGIDPGYLKHGKHAPVNLRRVPHLHPRGTKRGLQINCTRPYPPLLAPAFELWLVDVLAKYLLDGTIPSGGEA
jgi:hypothetical protein